MTEGGDAAQWLPVGECAAQLGVTLPRLLRALKRPDFAAYTQKQERQTKTGTRTVTLVSVSVLPTLKAVLHGAEGERERKQSQGEPLPFLADETVRAYLNAMMQQADARIAEQAATIADLRRDKDDLRGQNGELTRRLESAECERERLRAELLALPSADAVQNTPQEATQADLRADSGADSESAKRPFWAFWKAKSQ